MSQTITLKWNKQDVSVGPFDPATTSVEEFKMLIYSQTMVPPDRMKILGLGGPGFLKDTDNLAEKIGKTKPGAKIQLMGTAEGGELKKQEETKFVEDMSAEEIAAVLKEKKAEILPSGLSNLGNTCFANATLHMLKTIPEFKEALVPASGGQVAAPDTALVGALKQLFMNMEKTTEAVTPLQFIATMRQRFPQFAVQNNGVWQQQDAEEFLRELLVVVGMVCNASGKVSRVAIKNQADVDPESTLTKNLADELFGFRMRATYKCLESDDEPVTTQFESQRIFLCHLGSATEPISHMHEGVKLSLKEHIEKNTTPEGPLGGRSAQWEKSSAMTELPPYLFVQFARFGYKGANEHSGTSASRVKHVRKCTFPATMDVFDFCTPELQADLKVGRLKAREKVEDDDERKQRAIAATGADAKKDDNAMDVDSGSGAAASSKSKYNYQEVPSSMSLLPEGPGYIKDIVNNPDNLPLKDFPSGQYELVGIVSHKGRTAEGGHYVSWLRAKKAAHIDDEAAEGQPKKKVKKGSEEDTWYCFDDEDVTQHLYKDITGLNVDLQGGKADTHIAYFMLYRRVPCIMPDAPPRDDLLTAAEKAEIAAAEAKK